MKLTLNVYHSLPCKTEIFIINGIEANYEDFVVLTLDSDGNYGCYAGLENKLPTNDILKKYKIDVDEYAKVCNKLNKELVHGHCSWCL